jgi:hypothetical protein
MAVKFLSDINLGQNELEGAVVKNYPTASLPSGASGQIAYDSTVNKLKFFNGTAWVVVGDNTTYDLSVQAGGANDSVIRLAGSDTTNDDVTISGGTNVTITESGNTITIASTDTNNYVTAASFGTSTGVLTLNRSGLADVTVSLDGRYLQSYVETQNLQDVTTLGAVTTDSITVGGLIVNGDLTVSGAVQTKVSETLLVEDALFVLNSNETGAPTNDSGFVVERGTSANEMFIWDESADEWIVASTTETGSTAGNAAITSYSKMHVGAFIAGDTVNFGTVVNAGVDTDKFLVLDATGNVDFRTGAEVLSDIGGQASGSYITSFNTAGDTGTGSITNGETLTVNGSGLISVALSGDTFTVSTTANNYTHPSYSTITQNNSGFTFIQDISVDAIGSVTSVATGTVSAATTSATGVVELATTSEAATGADSTRAVTAAGVNAYVVNREFAGDVGDGSSTSIQINHNLSSRDVLVQLYDNTTFESLHTDIERTTADIVTLNFSVAPSTNEYRVLISKVG